MTRRSVPVLVACAVLLGGCASATKRLATDTNAIASTSASSKEKALKILGLLENPVGGQEAVESDDPKKSPSPDLLDGTSAQTEGAPGVPVDGLDPWVLSQVRTYATGIVHDQDEIIALTGDIHKTLPGVKDDHPWKALLELWAWVALIVALVVLLAWAGAFPFLRGIFASVALFFRPAIKANASMAVSVLDPNDKTEPAEFVARLRASDPAFDKAFEEAKRRRLEQRASSDSLRDPQPKEGTPQP